MRLSSASAAARGTRRALLLQARMTSRAGPAAAQPPWVDMASAAPGSAPAALAAAAALVPPLAPARHKGQAGRVAILGGCAEYTGAPFFAAMAALRTGADLAHVFCTPAAAAVIKGYAPDLIVHPALPPEKRDGGGGGGGGDAAAASAAAVEAAIATITAWLPRFDAVVVGPGLGRDPAIAATAAGVVAAARDGGAGLVLDADGLALVSSDSSLVRGYGRAILTPNAAEYGRLQASLGLGDGSPAGPPGDEAADAGVAALAAALAGPALLLKGAADRIACPPFATAIGGRGSRRRAGGQGDVLAGCCAAFLAWGVARERGGGGEGSTAAPPPVPTAAAAAAGGAALTRAAAARAFATHGRAMVAADVLGEVGPAFRELFGE